MTRKVTEFTESEMHAISDFAKREYKDMTSDEVMLYAEWRAALEIADARNIAEQNRLDDLMQSNIDMRKSEHEAAMENLRIEHEAALARLERIRGGNGW